MLHENLVQSSPVSMLVAGLRNRNVFPCLDSLIETRECLGKLETVMQARDEVKDLHNFREFSQPLECLYQAMHTQEMHTQAMHTQENISCCFYKITQVLNCVVTSKLCLHTLIQTHLSANQSALSIVVILLS